MPLKSSVRKHSAEMMKNTDVRRNSRHFSDCSSPDTWYCRFRQLQLDGMHCVRLAHVPKGLASSASAEDSLTTSREFSASRNVWRARRGLLALFRRPTFSHYVSRRAS